MAEKLLPGQRPPGWKAPDGSPPPKNRTGCIVAAVVVVGGLIVLSMLGSNLQQQDKAEREAVAGGVAAGSKPLREVTPQELLTAYAANEVAAKAEYDGQRLKMTGKLHDITLDVTDRPVLKFETGEPYDQVLVNFEKEDSPAIASLAKGQSATVICDTINELMGTPVLSDCSLAQ